MCGIAGLIYDPQGDEPMDWPALLRAIKQLMDSPHGVSPDAFEAAVAELERLGPSLREYSVFETLYADQAYRQMMHDGAQTLARWEADTQARVLEAVPPLGSDLLEKWNALWVRARDLAWLMERDVLGTQDRVANLLPEAWRAFPKARFEAWKMAAVLENIGRLEVRGRDSLGVSLIATFPDAAVFAAFRAWIERERLEEEWQSRRQLADFVTMAIVVDDTTTTPSVLFTFKVAQEVGALGDNVARLNEQIRGDRILWRAVAGETADDATAPHTNVYAHTRWASNGIISEPNCHPVNNETFARDGAHPSTPWITAALNGDVDNYQELVAHLQKESGLSISPRITTDTKIIPVEIMRHHAKGGGLREAFCKAVAEFEGSVAIVMHSTGDPYRTYLALRGSGQAMFVGIGPHGYVFASELYGVVEQTARFVRMDGTTERVVGRPETAGQVFVLDSRRIDGVAGIEAWSFDGERIALTEKDVRTAEITTRDINRGTYEHFLLKEIAEAPNSVQKTLQGKFYLDDARGVTLNLGQDVFPTAVAERLRNGQIRRVFLIGQGTAAVAGAAVASMMERTLAAAPLSIRAVKASELSGYGMTERMDDSIVIAISQSGTTTDTNRTVDMARSRGAAAIAIVNRRNADLVYKVDGVLYTSDGRDIEMSVASTKAFYSQVVAGYLLALHMGQVLGVLTRDQARGELEELSRLPDKMRKVLKDQEGIHHLAETHATSRRDWAVVGSGSTRAAADEIRIKLSELCYKSIATDFIEDKKHIDLSSEPLTLICAAGLPLMALRDAVKEVAIFKSHKSIPIVIGSEGFDAFERYAAGVIYVPLASENASVLLNTLVGHLWGYYCARAIDRGAAQLRPARAVAVQQLSEGVTDTLPPGTYNHIRQVGRKFQSDLASGLYNSSLSVDTGAQLSNLFHFFTSGRSLGQFSADFKAQGTPATITETLVAALSRAIHELTRPIDAIKHQAKTVTVGISRQEETLEGVLFNALREAAVPLEGLAYRDLAVLRAITPATRRVAGATVYEVRGLGTLGEPLEQSTVHALRKQGMSQGLESRADSTRPLVGTKESVVRYRSCFVGLGRKDQRPIAIIPILPSGQVEGLVLLHLEFQEGLPHDQKAMVLRNMGNRYDDLKSQVTETDLAWHDHLLEAVAVADLVTLPVDKLAEQIIRAASAAPVAT